MKKAMLALLITLASNAALADLTDEERTFCSALSDLSQTVMTKRQDGLQMAELMRIADGNPVVELLIISAYEEPRWSVPRNRTEAIENFQNEQYLTCITLKRES
jgi:hypothetical protein